MKAQDCVFIVEDDHSMRNALNNLLRSAGLESQLFASAEEFLDADRPDLPSCLVLDVRLPGLAWADSIFSRSYLRRMSPSLLSSSLRMETFQCRSAPSRRAPWRS